MAKKDKRTLYDAAEVARQFQITPKTLARYIRTGRFPRPRVVGGKRRWSQEDLDGYILHADRWYPGDDAEVEDDDEGEGPGHATAKKS
jgi:excisionase family DNA binding protein